MTKLTESQKQQIFTMRRNGMGYRTVAAEMGLSRDVVRNFCRSNSIDGYAKNFVNKTVCPTCGKVFVQPVTTGRRRRFCSEQCRREYWKNHTDELKSIKYYHVCACCGQVFQDRNLEKKYCSHQCYVSDRFYREEAIDDLMDKLLGGQEVDYIPDWLYEPLKVAVRKQEEIRRQVAKLNEELEK